MADKRFHDWRQRADPKKAVCILCGLQVEDGVSVADSEEEAMRILFECRDVQAWNVGLIEEKT